MNKKTTQILINDAIHTIALAEDGSIPSEWEIWNYKKVEKKDPSKHDSKYETLEVKHTDTQTKRVISYKVKDRDFSSVLLEAKEEVSKLAYDLSEATTRHKIHLDLIGEPDTELKTFYIDMVAMIKYTTTNLKTVKNTKEVKELLANIDSKYYDYLETTWLQRL